MYNYIKQFYNLEFEPGDFVVLNELGSIIGQVQKEKKGSENYLIISYRRDGKFLIGAFHPQSVQKINLARELQLAGHGGMAEEMADCYGSPAGAAAHVPSAVKRVTIDEKDLHDLACHAVHHGNCNLSSWSEEFDKCDCGLFALIARIKTVIDFDSEQLKEH